MDLSVLDAAHRLGLSESRIRQLLVAGDLKGRRIGRAWLVDSDDVARLQGQQRGSGRPLGPKRAWALLDLLNGGSASWLSYSERSQVRSYAARLNEPSADEWRKILRGRSELRPVRAHPAAVKRLSNHAHVLVAGRSEAVGRGFDLIAIGEPTPEFYIPINEWDDIARSLALQPSLDGNLLIHHPMVVWPFQEHTVPDGVLAADLLRSGEPRAVRAGRLRLNELLYDMAS